MRSTTIYVEPSTILDMESIGDRLRELRGDLTQPEMADIVGTTKQYVSQLERGVNNTPNGTFLEGWARHFRVRHQWLVTGKGPREAPHEPSQVGEDRHPYESQPARFNDNTMTLAVELVHLLADARPDDIRFRRPTWSMFLVAAKAVHRAEGASREAMAEILSELAKEV